MVYINPCLMLGSIVEVKRSDGTWEEGVIADIYNIGLGCYAEVTENDHFTVRFSDGRTKRILMQQEIELFMRPVHDTAGYVVSQMEVLENRKRARDSGKPVEAEDFAATQESQTMPVRTGLPKTMTMPPQVGRPKRSRSIAASSTQPLPHDDDDLDDEDLLAACAMFESRPMVGN